MKRHILWGLMAAAGMFICGSSYAADLADGTYTLNDGKMEMTLMINKIPDGKYFVNGSGRSRDGKTCRIGDLAELKGDRFVIGTCQMDISVSRGGFKLKDAGSCAPCEPGAYISGSYQKQ
jgi:hypothetical protein